MMLVYKQYFSALLFLIAGSAFGQTQEIVPPVATRVPYTIHGEFGDREDPYYWLKERNDKKVIDYLKADRKSVV